MIKHIKEYCEYLIYIFLAYAPILMISMPIWGISSMILYHNLEKKYPDKIPILFPGRSHPKDFPRTYGFGGHYFTFDKMIFTKDKILTEDKRKTFFVAYVSGILFHIGAILMLLMASVCIIMYIKNGGYILR